jgi:phosphatidate cytidylyltransferase
VQRIITGSVYVGLLLLCIFWGFETYAGLIFVFGLACLYELKKIIKLKSPLAYLLYIGLCAYFYWMPYGQYELWGMLGLTLLIQIQLIFSLFNSSAKRLNNLKKTGVSFFYVGGGILFLILLSRVTGEYSPELITGVMFLMWTNDSFAYLVGRRFGKHKWVPQISPKKSGEGYIGGLIFSLLMAWGISFYVPILSLLEWILLALVVVVFGNLGDLVESSFKRKAGVKDSGDLLPGHGGLLDRLDSLLIAAPFAFLMLHLLHYVSS